MEIWELIRELREYSHLTLACLCADRLQSLSDKKDEHTTGVDQPTDDEWEKWELEMNEFSPIAEAALMYIRSKP